MENPQVQIQPQPQPIVDPALQAAINELGTQRSLMADRAVNFKMQLEVANMRIRELEKYVAQLELQQPQRPQQS